MLPPPKPPASGTANSRTNSNHTSNSIGSNPLGSTSSAAAPGAAFYTRPPLPARSSASSASTSTQTSYNSSNASSPSVGGTPGTSSGLVSASASGQWGQSGAGSTGAGSWTRVAGYPAPVGSEGEYLELSAAGPSRGRDGPPRPSRVDGGYGSGVHVMGGMFAGKTMRFSLTMAQQPIHGRRKTEKDRRPLAHCPILRLRMLECVQRADGSGRVDEQVVDVMTIEPGNFVCAAELCDVVRAPEPVTDRTHGPSRSAPQVYSASVRGTPTPRRRNSTSQDVGGDTTLHESNSPPRPGPLLRPASWSADGQPGVTGQVVRTQYIKGASLDRMPTNNAPPSGSSSATATPTQPDSQAGSGQRDDDIELDTPPVAGSGPSRAGHARTAGERSSGSSGSGDSVLARRQAKRAKHPVGDSTSSATMRKLEVIPPRNLYGSLHVPGVRVLAPEGDTGLWFMFTDLTVRQEGTYALKFRCFDITAASKTSLAPVLVEANSQAFKVYSPRNFPGLPKPTELAEHFGRQGFKLNTRKNERQAKSPPPSPPERPAPKPIQSHGNTPTRVTDSQGYQREHG